MCVKVKEATRPKTLVAWSFSVCRFFRRLGGDQIFRGYDLPLPIAKDPSVGPDETSAKRCSVRRTQDSSPCATAVSPKKANLHIVETVGDEFLGSFARVGDHLGFFVKTPIGIYARKSSARMRSTTEASPLKTDSAHWRSLSLM